MSLTDSNFQPNEGGSNNVIQSLGGQIVLSAHNLCPDNFNCDKLFNIVSLYGNVDKVSKKKPILSKKKVNCSLNQFPFFNRSSSFCQKKGLLCCK